MTVDGDGGDVERAVRATALGRGTYGVPDLRRLVDGALHTAFPHRIWVAGRVSEVRDEPAVGLHFTLLALDDDDEPFTLCCLLPEPALGPVADVLDRVHDVDVQDLVAPDRLVRVGGLLRYDPARATLVLAVSELDPAPTARGLREQREAARALVAAHSLPERQAGRPPRAAPLSVSLVGVDADSAVKDAVLLLQGSAYAVDLREVRVSVHGREAPSTVAAAVHEAALRSDVVLLVRGTGRPLALSVFDSAEVAFAVAQAQVPVVTGLGGAGEWTASDDVAHAALADGPAAAAWVLRRLDDAADSLRILAEDVEQEAAAALQRARDDLVAARDDVLRTAEQAQARAASARTRLRRRALIGLAVIVVAVVVVTVLTGLPLVLLGLLVVPAALLTAKLWMMWMQRRGSMSRQDDAFAEVLGKLERVRDELATTSSPETVHRLREVAVELLARGDQVLAGG